MLSGYPIDPHPSKSDPTIMTSPVADTLVTILAYVVVGARLLPFLPSLLQHTYCFERELGP